MMDEYILKCGSHEITVMDFVNRFISKTIIQENEMNKALPDLVQLVKEGMASRSPQLYLSMVKAVYHFVTKAGNNLTDDKRQRRELAETTYRLVELCLKIASDHTDNTIAGDSKGNIFFSFLFFSFLFSFLFFSFSFLTPPLPPSSLLILLLPISNRRKIRLILCLSLFPSPFHHPPPPFPFHSLFF